MLTGQMMIDILTAAPVRPSVADAALKMALVDIPKLTDPGDDGASRPVIAVDLDGVLNALGCGARAKDGVSMVDTVIPAWAGAEGKFLNGHGKWNVPVRVAVDPAHGTWIRSLIARGVDVVWCTSWETAAPIVYGSLLGLPPLPVIRLTPVQGVLAGRGSVKPVDYKAAALASLFPGRPLVWLDDDNEHYRYGDWRPAIWPTLVPDISGYSGLTADIREQVDAWLAATPTCPRTRFDELPTGGSSGEHSDILDDVWWKVRTTEGSVTLRRYHERGRRRWSVSPTAKLRRMHNLATHLWVDHVAAALGEPLTATIGTGHWDNGSDQWVDPPKFTWGTVTRIDCLGAPHVDYRPFSSWHTRLPDLAAARAAQTAAAQAAAAAGLGEVSFKSDSGMTAWAGDTPIMLETAGAFYTIEAQVPTGEIDGKLKYGWCTVAVGQTSKLSYGTNRGLEPVTTATAVAAAWTTYDRAAKCPHPHPGDRYCRECGTENSQPEATNE